MGKVIDTIKSAINPDDTNRGYEDGYKRGLEGKDRSFVRVPLSWKQLAHPLSNVPTDTYIEGYKKGHQDGERHRMIRPGELKPQATESHNTVNNFNTGTTMSYGHEAEIELLEAFITYENGVIDELYELIGRDTNALETMADDGLSSKFKGRLDDDADEERRAYAALIALKEEKVAKCRRWIEDLENV